jgi:hypothetical protein
MGDKSIASWANQIGTKVLLGLEYAYIINKLNIISKWMGIKAKKLAVWKYKYIIN